MHEANQKSTLPMMRLSQQARTALTGSVFTNHSVTNVTPYFSKPRQRDNMETTRGQLAWPKGLYIEKTKALPEFVWHHKNAEKPQWYLKKKSENAENNTFEGCSKIPLFYDSEFFASSPRSMS